MAEGSRSYELADPQTLAADTKNLTIPHTAIRRLVLTKGFGGSRLLLEYERGDGKRKRFLATVAPPQELLKQRKREGVSREVALRDYATKVQIALQRALPASAAGVAEWKL